MLYICLNLNLNLMKWSELKRLAEHPKIIYTNENYRFNRKK